MSSLTQQIHRTIRRHQLCPPDARLLIGLSGGSDSVALTLLLRDLSERGGPAVTALAHFNHRLRPTANRDEQFCREFAAGVSLPLVVSSLDVAGYAASERISLEEAARRSRYAFLHRTAADVGADRIAVGHTRDDQAETVLLKLIRGAGPTGLGGIYPRRGIVIRPLLDLSRAELRSYLQARGQVWMEDESNDALTNPRNRIRHRVLPELEQAYGGGVSAAISRAAAIAREDGQWLDQLARERFEGLGEPRPDGLAFEAARLLAEPPPIRRRILLEALRQLAASREVGLDHVDAALEVLAGFSAATEAPGCRLELRRGKLVLQRVGPGEASK